MSNPSSDNSAKRSNEIVDVPFETPLYRRLAILVGVSVPVVIAAFVIVLNVARIGPVLGACVSVALAFGVLLLGFQLASRSVERRVAREVLSVPSTRVAAAVRRVVDSTRIWHPMFAMRAMTRAMATAGHTALAVRVGPQDDLLPVRPLAIPFEPQMLDETETSFRQLCASDGEAPVSTGDGVDNLGVRRIKRNVALKGGWLLGVALGLGVAIQLILIAFGQRPTWAAVLAFAVFLEYLFVPAWSSGNGRTELLAVPGGLIARKAKRDGWLVKLFARASSTLCVYRAGRRRWTVVIADAEQAEMASCTQTEAMFALRAWLSPLDPPSPDRLSDLA